MMEMSSMIDASLAFGGAITVMLIGISMVTSESTTVSTSYEIREQHDGNHCSALKAAA